MKKDRGDFRLRKEISQKRYVVSAIITFIVIFAAWMLLCVSGSVKELFLPSPAKVVNDIIQCAKDGSLWVNMGYSIFRITMGFIISTLIGVPLGILAGSFNALKQSLHQFVSLFVICQFRHLYRWLWYGVESEKVPRLLLYS